LLAVGATLRRLKYAGLSFFAICFLAPVDNLTATILSMSLPNRSHLSGPADRAPGISKVEPYSLRCSMKFNLKNLFTRREILETVGLGAALLPAVAASQQKEQPPNYQAGKEQPQSYQVGKDPGKHEPLANFKYDIESTTGWVGEAGSAKEATVAEFPASQNIAGVSMRLKPGGHPRVALACDRRGVGVGAHGNRSIDSHFSKWPGRHRCL